MAAGGSRIEERQMLHYVSVQCRCHRAGVLLSSADVDGV
jgi:hypothetical protein